MNIDGKTQRYGKFVEDLGLEIDLRADQGEKVTHIDFILDKGDPDKEK